MKGIYLCAYKANHPNFDLVYQDKFVPRDLGGDCVDVDLSPYDFVICTPPCNWWSHLQRNRDKPGYARDTYHLLPVMLLKLTALGKPFIVENVKNDLLFGKFGLFLLPLYVYTIGRHTYWTNHPLDYIPSQKGRFVDPSKLTKSKREGYGVSEVIEAWMESL